jgi:hypothetical protein
MKPGLARRAAFVLGVCLCASGQVIEFESKGLKYQTLTKRGVTVMYAHLAAHMHEFSILQVAVSNGSPGPYTIRPEDFTFVREDGEEIHAWAARSVVSLLMQKGGRSDVIKLVAAYETALYGIPHMRTNNGYEQRREAAFAELTNARFKAAAEASAIALVQTKLGPGESTDGAVFFGGQAKGLGSGRLIVHTNTDTFEFQAE